MADNKRGPEGHRAEFRPGELVRGYEIADLLASGGYGQVYRVFDRRGNVFVLKVAWMDSKMGLDLRHEARIMSRYGEHSGLPKLYYSWEESGYSFLLMDYIEGENLDSFIVRLGRPMREERASGMLWHMLDILRYLHTRPQPILHLDLKTSQFLLDRNCRPYLMDFGVARQMPRGARALPLSFGCGTEAYSAPEQYVPEETVVDERADIYAIGATAYRMLTFHHPPKHGPIPWERCEGQISPKFLAALKRATAMYVGDRFRSIQEMMEHIYR